jgi:hypothetical protein
VSSPALMGGQHTEGVNRRSRQSKNAWLRCQPKVTAY